MLVEKRFQHKQHCVGVMLKTLVKGIIKGYCGSYGNFQFLKSQNLWMDPLKKTLDGD